MEGMTASAMVYLLKHARRTNALRIKPDAGGRVLESI